MLQKIPGLPGRGRKIEIPVLVIVLTVKFERNEMKKMAEREGFEPSVSLTPHTLSRRAPSAARPSLRRKAKESLTDKTD